MMNGCRFGLFFHAFLLWLMLAACDKVKEPAMPALSESDGPRDLVLASNAGDSVVFQLFSDTTLRKQIVVTVQQPTNGTIIPSGNTGMFTYVPGNGFSGVDSLTYTYCLGNSCREATVKIQVTPPCTFSLAADQFEWENRSDNTASFPIFFNDALAPCTTSFRVVQSSDGVLHAELKNGQMEVSLKPLVAGNFQLTYEVCAEGAVCKTAIATIQSYPSALACEQQFKANSDTITLPQGFYFKVFQADDLLRNDNYCTANVDPSSFRIVQYPPTEGPGKLVFQTNAWWYVLNNPQGFVSDRFTYSICNNNGKCDTASAIIYKPW